MANVAYNASGSGFAAGPGAHAVVVTPSDTTVFSPPLKSLWIGAAGPFTLAIQGVGDSTTVTLANVVGGAFQLCAVSKVLATGTTATNIIGFY